MPITPRSFTIRRKDKPGNAWEMCRLSPIPKVKLLAFQSFPLRKARVRFIRFGKSHSGQKRYSDQTTRQLQETTRGRARELETVRRELARAHRVGRRGNQNSTTVLRDRVGDNASIRFRRPRGREGKRRSLSWLPLPRGVLRYEPRCRAARGVELLLFRSTGRADVTQAVFSAVCRELSR